MHAEELAGIELRYKGRQHPWRSKRQAVATPETRNNSESRHGEVNIISGSMAFDACGLFTCQSQVT
jgi:hypothetical protein